MSLVLLLRGSVAIDLAGLGVAQAQATDTVTLVMVAADRRPRILGQSFVPIDMATW